MPKKKKDLAQLESWYKEELTRRDELIDQLKQENRALIATALHQSKRLAEISAKMHKLIGRKK